MRTQPCGLYRGSPPQVRGKLYHPLCTLAGNRITPAGAGKTNPVFNVDFAYRDHPRRCGENMALMDENGSNGGSPPQVRGKPQTSPNPWSINRITPAGAGKTRIKILRGGQHQDHPRRCGENLVVLSSGFIPIGSPPQVRGKPELEKLCSDVPGITPAGAGKTGYNLRYALQHRDHPRRCGENHGLSIASMRSWGSPPQVRGKQTYMGYSFFNNRITPAGAGKTCPASFQQG